MGGSAEFSFSATDERDGPLEVELPPSECPLPVKAPPADEEPEECRLMAISRAL